MKLLDALEIEVKKLIPKEPNAGTRILKLAGQLALGLKAITDGRWHKSMVESTAREVIENRSLGDGDRNKMVDDLATFQWAMDEIICSNGLVNKQTAIIALSKAFIIGQQAPQSDEMIAAFRTAARTDIGKQNAALSVLARQKEAQETWHPHATELAKACQTPRSLAAIARHIRDNWRLGKSLLPKDRQLERFVKSLAIRGEIKPPEN
jgi:hypothetical protein